MLTDFKGATEGAVKPVKGLGTGLSDLAVAAGVATAAIFALKKAFVFAKEGAEIEYTRQKFDRLARSIGTTGDALAVDLHKATSGMMSDAEMMASASDLMALGLAKTVDEAVRLTTVASKLGMPMNQLVLTLTNQTLMRFDQLGVSVDGFNEKVEKLKQSGMNANDAFREAFLQQAEAQIQKVGDKAESAAGKIIQLESAWKNLKNAFSTGIADDAVRLINLATGPIQDLADYITLITKLQAARKAGIITSLEASKIEAQVELTGYSAADAIEYLTKKEQEHEAQLKRETAALWEKARALAAASGAPPQDQKSLYMGLVGKSAAPTAAFDSNALKMGLSGPLAAENQAYQEQVKAVKQTITDLEAEIYSLNSKSYLTAEQQSQLGQAQYALAQQKAAVGELAAEHDKATSKILIDMMMQVAAAQQAGPAVYQMIASLAAEWGVLDQASYQAFTTMLTGLSANANSTDWSTWAQQIRDIRAEALATSGDYYINFHVTTTGSFPGPNTPNFNFNPDGSTGTGGSAWATNPANRSYANPTTQAQYHPTTTYGGGSGGGGSGASAAATKTKTQMYLETASALSSLAQIAADNITKTVIEPLKAKIAAIDALITPGHIDVTMIDHAAEMMEERAKAAAKVAEEEKKILALQKAQQNLQLLEAQVRLLALIKENKLNASSVLGGMKLGLGVDMNALLAATTKALEAMVAKAESSMNKDYKTGKKGAKAASGLHMTVPPGYNNDSFVIHASSGENVDISWPGQGGGGGEVVNNFYMTVATDLQVEETARKIATIIKRHNW